MFGLQLVFQVKFLRDEISVFEIFVDIISFMKNLKGFLELFV